MGKTQPLKLFLIKRKLDNDNKFIRLFFKTHLTYEAVNLTVKHVNLKKHVQVKNLLSLAYILALIYSMWKKELETEDFFCKRAILKMKQTKNKLKFSSMTQRI